MRLPFSLPDARSRDFDVVALGLNSIDLVAVVSPFPAPDSKQRIRRFERLPGGEAATALVTCVRHGWRGRYVGRFGDDPHGTLALDSLRREQVDVEASLVLPGTFNRFAVILVDAETGARTVLWDRDERAAMTARDVPEAAIQSGRVLLVDCNDAAAATQAARYAHLAEMPTLVDIDAVGPGIEELLAEIDVIVAAAEFPARLTGEPSLGRALEAMAAQFPSAIMCVTLGREGSLTRAGGREILTPGFKVPVVDSTGAGDVFRGGFIAGWLAAGEGADLEEILYYANATAALKCRALGARTAIPRREEVEAFLRDGRINSPW